MVTGEIQYQPTKPKSNPYNFFFLIRLGILCCLLSCLSWQVPAQVFKSYQVTQLGVKDGFPSTDFMTIMQDHLENLWVGHSMGCTRFNGEQMDHFLYVGNNPVGKVFCIKEDNENRIWVASEKGLFIMEQDSLSIIHFKKGQISVYDISWDSSKNLWLGTSMGPIKIPLKNTKEMIAKKEIDLSAFLLTNWNKISNGFNKVTKIVHGKTDQHFLAAGSSIFSYTQQTFRLLWSTKDPRDFCISLEYLQNRLFICCAVSGLFTFDGGRVTPMQDGLIFCYSLIQKDNELICAAGSSIYSIDPVTLTITRVANIEERYIRWIKQVWKDHEGNFWLAGNEGLLYLKPLYFHQLVRNSESPANELYSILKTSSGKVIAGSNRGKIFDIRKDTVLPATNIPPVVPNAEVFGMQQDKNGAIWFGTGYQGISCFQQNRLQNFTTKNGLRDNTNVAFLETTNGRLFTCGDHGVSEIISDKTTGKVTFKNFPYTSNINTYSQFTSLTEDHKGNIWAGSEFGLFKVGKDSLQPIQVVNAPLPVLHITDMKTDNTGKIWLSTLGAGVLSCVINADNTPVLTKQYFKDGIFKNIGFLNLLFDNTGICWIAAYNGIFRLDPVTSLFSYFDVGDGFLSPNYKYIQLLQSDDTTIYAASSYGTVSFNPTEFIAQKTLDKINITKVVQNDSILLYSPTFSQKKYRLSYNKRNIKIYFNEVSFANPSAIQYQYRLVNLDSSWIRLNNVSFVNLNDLSPGHYTFEVRASSGLGVWSEPARFSFEIAPPIWLNFWVIALVALALFLIIYLFLKYRVANIRKQEARKTELETIKANSLQLQLEMEKVIGYFASSISDKNSVDEVLWDVAKNCIAKLGYEDCVIYLADDERKILYQKAAWGPKTTEENKILNPLAIPFGKGVVGFVAATGKAEIIGDTSKDTRYIIDDAIRNSEICVPILDQDKVIGVIDSEHVEKNFYTTKDLQLLTTIASLCGEKIKKVRAESSAREKEIELIKLQSDLAASQLTALRTQMNPHFIFNSLNSVQQYILTGNVDDANRYISKFSKLQREILNQSDKHFISLEKEIDMLTLYLQLEQLRFDKSFSFHIAIDEAIDVSEIKIPPMIMQPFVENAIWHGLSSQVGEKKIDIAFELLSEDLLLAIVKDNGIGREASAKLKEQTGSSAQHHSRGLSLITERLDILKKQYNRPFEASIADLRDPTGKVIGTRITLQIHIL